jgi:hypothetical protein
MPAAGRPPHHERNQPPTDELVLAALGRALAHGQGERELVRLATILEHLAAPPRGATARQVSARLAGLALDGWLYRSRRSGTPAWSLTDAGRERLRRMRAEGALRALPESPQHRAWRNARRSAGEEIDRFRGGLGELIARAAALLQAPQPPASDRWFALGADLERACWRLGSASHCLYEWREPPDQRADVDDHRERGDARLAPDERERARARRRGRRNTGLW